MQFFFIPGRATTLVFNAIENILKKHQRIFYILYKHFFFNFFKFFNQLQKRSRLLMRLYFFYLLTHNFWLGELWKKQEEKKQLNLKAGASRVPLVQFLKSVFLLKCCIFYHFSALDPAFVLVAADTGAQDVQDACLDVHGAGRCWELPLCRV